MKKALFFLLLAFTIDAAAQATATQPPDIHNCNGEVFHLTTQTPIILNGQDPQYFVVTYYMTATNAENGTNPIANPASFVGPTNATLYARVDSLLDDSYAITQFQVSWESVWAPQMTDVTACGSYSLPPLPAGTYYTSPNGTGAPHFPGEIVTLTTLFYVFVPGQFCSAETYFQITIQPFEPITELPAMAFSCEPWELPSAPEGTTYYINQQPITSPMSIAESTLLGVSTGPPCWNMHYIEVLIGAPPVPQDLPDFVVCSADGSPYGVFDLWSYNANFLTAIGGFPAITYHVSEADAETGDNAISNVSDYTNATPNTQTLYARLFYGDPACHSIAAVKLVVTPCTDNTISGTIQLDFDNNGCTPNDIAGGGTKLTCTHNGNTFETWTDQQGHYSFYNVQEGSNTVAIVETPQNFTAPGAQPVTVTGNETTTDGIDFCLGLTDPVVDVMAYVYPSGPARPGFPAYYVLYVYNSGTMSTSGTITLHYDSSILTFGSAGLTPLSQGEGTITFAYDTLLPLHWTSVGLHFLVATPPTANAGTLLAFETTATTDAGADIHPEDNTFPFVQTVVNSWDPNDITVLEGAFITEEQADGWLNYVIRFENTGTAEALNIRVDNQLDANLDWSTFTPVLSSHHMLTQRSGNNVTFRFDGINLPATTQDAMGSHGFISYKIKPVAGFGEGSIISNTAHIFFDFNEAVTTNTVTTELETLHVDGHLTDAFTMYPNPAKDVLHVRTSGTSVEITISDITGKALLRNHREANGGEATVDVSSLPTGLYLVRLSSEGRSQVRKLVIK